MCISSYNSSAQIKTLSVSWWSIDSVRSDIWNAFPNKRDTFICTLHFTLRRPIIMHYYLIVHSYDVIPYSVCAVGARAYFLSLFYINDTNNMAWGQLIENVFFKFINELNNCCSPFLFLCMDANGAHESYKFFGFWLSIFFFFSFHCIQSTIERAEFVIERVLNTEHHVDVNILPATEKDHVLYLICY